MKKLMKIMVFFIENAYLCKDYSQYNKDEIYVHCRPVRN